MLSCLGKRQNIHFVWFMSILYIHFLYVGIVSQILKSVDTCWDTGLLFLSVISLRCHIHNGQHFIQSPFQSKLGRIPQQSNVRTTGWQIHWSVRSLNHFIHVHLCALSPFAYGQKHLNLLGLERCINHKSDRYRLRDRGLILGRKEVLFLSHKPSLRPLQLHNK
jgi:hypothetical protein